MIVIAEHRDKGSCAFELPEDVRAADIARMDDAIALRKELYRLFRQFVMSVGYDAYRLHASDDNKRKQDARYVPVMLEEIESMQASYQICARSMQTIHKVFARSHPYNIKLSDQVNTVVELVPYAGYNYVLRKDDSCGSRFIQE